MDSLDLYYLDACIFFEYCNDEQIEPLKKQAIIDLFSENQAKRNRICTSVITHVEVLPSKLAQDAEDQYLGYFNSKFFFDIEIDRSVIALSRQIKDYYYEPAAQGSTYKMMSTGDAIHLATAIINNVTYFYTRDKNNRNGNIPLVGLPQSSPGGKLCGIYDLHIINPTAQQGRLDGL